MNFFSRFKKELILGAVMILLGGGIFLAGASMTGESIRMPGLPASEEKQEETEAAEGEGTATVPATAPETAPEAAAEETAPETAAEKEAAKEEEKAQDEAPAEEAPKAEESAEVRAEEAEAQAAAEKTGEEEKAAEEKAGEEEKTAEETAEKKKNRKKKKKEETVQEQGPYDEEAKARKDKGEFIGQIDAIIAAEDFWGKYPRQIPEGYTQASGYTYDTWISHDPSKEEPWYEITLCITDHKKDTKVDRRAKVDAYSGKVIEDKKVN